MTATPSTSAAKQRAPKRTSGAPRYPDRPTRRRERGGLSSASPLGEYSDSLGRPREILVRPGAAGTALLIDRDAMTLGDCRLIAHLAADEPAQNAVLVCREYLAAPADARVCRAVEPHDLRAVPFGETADVDPGHGGTDEESALVDRAGRTYRLEIVDGEMTIPLLRWRRYDPRDSAAPSHTVSLREVAAALESYEPLCAISERALRRHRDDDRLSTVRLAAELERMRDSPIVLNRLLRSAVLATIEREGSSLSQIAIRCGRTKRDRNGVQSGETSWLARRIGILAEGGHDAPTPWIHSDVLGLIARRGLGISPREVELH